MTISKDRLDANFSASFVYGVCIPSRYRGGDNGTAYVKKKPFFSIFLVLDTSIAP